MEDLKLAARAVVTLTDPQRRLLDIIKAHIAETGNAPSYEQMKVSLGFASKSSVHRLMISLEQRGAIRRIPGKHRAIAVVEAEAQLTDAQRFDLGKAIIAEIDQLCADEGLAIDSPMFRRWRRRIKEKYLRGGSE